MSGGDGGDGGDSGGFGGGGYGGDCGSDYGKAEHASTLGGGSTITDRERHGQKSSGYGDDDSSARAGYGLQKSTTGSYGSQQKEDAVLKNRKH